MNNDVDNKVIAKDIVNRLAQAVENSVMLLNYINTAKEDAIRRTVRFYARDVIRDECSSGEIDTNELAKTLGISFEGFDDWEAGVIREVSEKACEELKHRIQVSVIPESNIPEHTKKPIYQLLME